MHLRKALLATVALGLCATIGPRQFASGASVHADSQSSYWIAVDPARPSTLYAYLAGSLIKNSTDGGAHWRYLPSGVPRGDYAQSCSDGISPAIIDPESHDLYISYSQSTDPVCRTGVTGVLRSHDGGLTYDNLGSDTTFTLAEPIRSRRLYMASGTNNGDYLSPPECAQTVSTRGPSDMAWHAHKGPAGVQLYRTNANVFCFDMVDDPHQLMTVYANTIPVTRSEDGGLTWTTVVTPTTTPPLTDFSVSYDPAAGNLLEGVTGDKQVPNDHVFLSADHGRTWTTTTCPGDHNGTCPRIVLQNVFGAGAAYAVFADGIYSFQGASPATARLPLSDHLPFSLKQVLDMPGGTRYGDSIYALLRDGRLFRSDDGGRNWHLLDAKSLPTGIPARPAPGVLAAGPHHHTIDPHFIATYRTLGPYVLGYPVDEAYQYGNTLTQDFEHLRLVWRQHQVAVADLGSEAANSIGCGMGTDDPNGFCTKSQPVRPTPTTPTSRYFPATHHTLSGDLLRFWQQHGGLTVLGAPLTEVYRAENGDGSKRTYQMQLFTKARLERHPENHNPRYAILLGLLGIDVLHDRGWLP